MERLVEQEPLSLSPGQLLAKCRRARDLTQESLAQKMGWSVDSGAGQARLSNYERDRRSIKLPMLKRFAEVLNFPLTVLLGAKPLDEFLREEQLEKSDHNVTRPSMAAQPAVTAPLIDWAQLSDPAARAEGGPPIRFTRDSSAKVFASRVEGDAMDSMGGMPTYPAGSVVIIDPNRSDCDNQAVVVFTRENLAATPMLRILRREGDRLFLVPINRQYPMVEFNNAHHVILGRVIETLLIDQDR